MSFVNSRTVLVFVGLGAPFVFYAACVGSDTTASFDAGADSGTSAADSSTSADSGGASTDGGTDGAASTPCDPTAAWEASGPESELNGTGASASDYDARLAQDQRTVYWVTERTGSPLIFSGTRGKVADPFGTLAQVPITLGGSPNGAGLGGAQTTLIFGVSVMFPEQSYGIYQALYSQSAWSSPAEIVAGGAPFGNKIGDIVEEPYVTPDGLSMIADAQVSDDAGTHRVLFDIERTTLTGTFGTPTRLTELDSADNQKNGVLSADKLTIYFATNRTLGSASPEFDVWFATRATPSAKFSAPSPVQGGQVNAGGVPNLPSFISDNQCTLYFSTSRATEPRFQVYRATRTPPM